MTTMPSPTTSSSDAAIQHLRAEIISPVWHLSPPRITPLRTALASLTSFFAKRAHGLALLKMATSVVDHIEQQGNEAKVLDFLKENLAHIVSFYEEDDSDPEKEKETVRRAYKRFLRLNIRLTTPEGLPATNKEQNASALLAKLEKLSKESALLPRLLEQTDQLSTEDRERAATLFDTISCAINIAWAHLPSAPNQD